MVNGVGLEPTTTGLKVRFWPPSAYAKTHFHKQA
jgi:hypothetical protein